ncbi:hypothetical protein ACKWTF_016840 [Chironomus riparius]
MSEIFRHTKKNVLKLFRKLSLKSTAESSSNEYKAKYQPQKNHSITISPSSNGHSRMKRLSHKNNKRDSTRHKKSKNDDLDDDDDDFTVPDRKRQSYIKSCIKKRLNNNYEKQINCIQDENVVFTDNKIYISLSARTHSSLGSNNSLKKNRRVIYPTSGPCKLNGFLRHYDFSYDDDNESELSKSAIENSEEKLKFNMMKEQSCLSTNSLDNVVFEKVKVKPSSPCSSNNYESPSSYIHVNNDDERNDDSILTSSTFITSYEADDEDDIQWKNFLELRKHGKPINNVSQLNDSGFGSQLFFSTNYNNNNSSYNNMRALDTWQDDETYDNSFNEELEQRVSIMFPDLYKASSQSAHFNNINNINHVTAEKLS